MRIKPSCTVTQHMNGEDVFAFRYFDNEGDAFFALDVNDTTLVASRKQIQNFMKFCEDACECYRNACLLLDNGRYAKVKCRTDLREGMRMSEVSEDGVFEYGE